jgi:hypothetical protein
MNRPAALIVALLMANGCGGLVPTSPLPAKPPPVTFRSRAADLVFLIDPYDFSAQLDQAAAVVGAASLPGEAVVVQPLDDNDVDDGDIEAAVNGWIAPPAPSPPAIQPAPVRPVDPSDLQGHQYASAVARWQALADRALQGWQQMSRARADAWARQLASTLRAEADSHRGHPLEDLPGDDARERWAVEKGVTRAALAIAAADTTPPGSTVPTTRIRILVILSNLAVQRTAGIPPGQLTGVHVVLANYRGATAPQAWEAAFTRAGARDVHVLPSSLTDSALPALVAGLAGVRPASP